MKYFNAANLLKLKNLSSRYSVKELFYKIIEKLQSPYRDYSANYTKYFPTQEELQQQKKKNFSVAPLVSIVVPTYETDELFLKQMIDSVIEQTYENWELCLADGSKSNKVQAIIERDYAAEKRICYKRLEKNAGISENTNQGFQMASGDYIALLDHDDLLLPSALYEMIKRINKTGADFLYSDEDKVTADLKEYMDPHFKLDFNRELLLGNNYICHFLMVSRELLQQAGGLNSDYDGAQDFEFVLRCTKYAKRMEHIRKVLYHWRVHPASTAGNTNSKLYAYEAGKRAIEDYIAGQSWQGTVTMTQDLGFYQTRYQVPENITIGVYLWGKDFGNFSKILQQIKQELQDLNIKVIWEYDLKEQVDYLLILNKGIVAMESDSISVLLGSCSRDGIGIVAGQTQKAGKVVQCGYWKKGEEYIARYRGLNVKFKGYYRRAYLPVEVDAVSKDCVVLKGNILESNLKNTEEWFGFCEQQKEKGRRIIAEPKCCVKIKET